MLMSVRWVTAFGGAGLEVALLASCDTVHGLSHQALLPGTPSAACVEKAIRDTPGVGNVVNFGRPSSLDMSFFYTVGADGGGAYVDVGPNSKGQTRYASYFRTMRKQSSQ